MYFLRKRTYVVLVAFINIISLIIYFGDDDRCYSWVLWRRWMMLNLLGSLENKLTHELQRFFSDGAFVR